MTEQATARGESTSSLPTTATLPIDAAGEDRWDVVVIGAGLAGALTACLVARTGQRVLLVDKQAFPRDKVCGACLSQHALAVLRQADLEAVPAALGGLPYDAFRLWSHGKSAEVPLPEGCAVSRRALDNHLVQTAIEAGADFLPETRAVVGALQADHREVRLEHAGRQIAIAAQVVVAANGIGGGVLQEVPEIEFQTWKQSRIGAGAELDEYPADYERGAIFMGVGRHGYAGLVRIEENRLNLGAALDAGFLKRAGGLGPAVAQVLEESGLPVPASLREAAWRGTPRFSRTARNVGAPRLFLVGDAAGYAEPFTGEGMAWAMSTSLLAAPRIQATVEDFSPALCRDWEAAYQRAIRKRQNACYRLAWLLRRPWLVRAAVFALARFPGLAGRIVRNINTAPEEVLT